MLGGSQGGRKTGGHLQHQICKGEQIRNNQVSNKQTIQQHKLKHLLLNIHMGNHIKALQAARKQLNLIYRAPHGLK